ncbi:MAG: hypothetical protein ACLTDV_08400 [Eubacterium sp.]
MVITAICPKRIAVLPSDAAAGAGSAGILITNAGFGDCGSSFLETDAEDSENVQMIDVKRQGHGNLLMKPDASPHGKAGGRLHFKCRFFGRTASGRPLYGHLLCDQSLHTASLTRGSGAELKR